MEIVFVEAYKEFGGLVNGILKEIAKFAGEIFDVDENAGIYTKIKSRHMEFSSYHDNLGSYLVVYKKDLGIVLEKEKYILLSDGNVINVDLWDYITYELANTALKDVDPEVIEKITGKELLLEEEFGDYVELSFDGMNMRIYGNKTQITLPNMKISESEEVIKELLLRMEEFLK